MLGEHTVTIGRWTRSPQALETLEAEAALNHAVFPPVGATPQRSFCGTQCVATYSPSAANAPSI